MDGKKNSPTSPYWYLLPALTCVIQEDIHPNNTLFEVPNLDSYTMKESEHDKCKEIHFVTRSDGTLDKRAPRYIAKAWPLIEHPCDRPGFTVKITDLGGGKFIKRTLISIHD